MRFLRSLALLPNYCHPPCLISAPNHAPVAADSAAGRQGVRSTTKGESRKRTEESLLSSGRFRLSPATGAGWQVARATPSFIQSTFTSQRSLLWYFLGLQESTVPPFVPPSLPFPPPPHEKAPSPSAGGGAIFKQKSSFIQPARRCPGFPGAHRSADRPKPRRSTARCSSHRSGAGRHS